MVGSIETIRAVDGDVQCIFEQNFIAFADSIGHGFGLVGDGGGGGGGSGSVINVHAILPNLGQELPCTAAVAQGQFQFGTDGSRLLRVDGCPSLGYLCVL